MKLVSTDGGVGRVDGEEIAVLDTPWAHLGGLLAATPGGPGSSGLEALAAAPVKHRLPLAGTPLLPVVPRPGKVWAVGLNYRTHIAEMGRVVPADPVVFVKVTSSVVGPGDAVRRPVLAPDRVDFEGEVAVVIGRRASSVAEADAWSYVAGITACDDVTARDVQEASGNFGLAKSFDTFCPLGASLATPDEYADPDDVGLETIVDGQTRQRSRTSDLLFPVPFLVSWLSRHTTLEPGDVISTGTPAGVGHPEGRYLQPGSTVEIRVEGVLPLVNGIADADPPPGGPAR
jgi:2-keto-4-pentenoate hydratase/2-oxohepta-3-ene-1,7-dioic acid hydratase in catechol pathway